MSGASPGLPLPEDDFDETLLSDVEEHGWHCVLVADDVHPEHAIAAASAGPHPIYDATFAYTVGLWRTHDHPELVLVGRWPGAHAVLAAAVAAIADGTTFAAGDESDEVLEGASVCFQRVSADRCDELLGYASWLNGGRRVEALQLVLPDRQHRWPWQGEYGACPQPLLTPR